MSAPSPNRKYYIVPAIIDPDLGGLTPKITKPGWTARFLSSRVALVRDPDGEYSYPVLGLDVSVQDALSSLPIELSMSMTQQEANETCDALGLNRVNLEHLSSDRVGGL